MPADRTPARCPTCGGVTARRPVPVHIANKSGVCPDAFHDQPAETQIDEASRAVFQRGAAAARSPQWAVDKIFAEKPTDSRSPAQVAEDEEREAHEQARFGKEYAEQAGCNSGCSDRFAEIDAAITRALAAKAWATAEEMLKQPRPTGMYLDEWQNAIRDRLRRAYEEAIR